jgi:hypothetical protein
MLRLADEWKLIHRIPRIRLLRGEKPREFVLSPQSEQIYLPTCPDKLRTNADPSRKMQVGLKLIF